MRSYAVSHASDRAKTAPVRIACSLGAFCGFPPPHNFLRDTDVAIANIAGYNAGYCDKILYACAPHDNQLMAIERT